MDYRKKLNDILNMAGVKTANEDLVLQEAIEVTEELNKSKKFQFRLDFRSYFSFRQRLVD